MNKVKKYLLEILLALTCVGVGITLLACNSNTNITPSPSPTKEQIPIATATPVPTKAAEPTATPEPTDKPLEFTTGTKDYFADALFIGDSRTVGLSEYADLGDATFFADVGMNSFKVLDEKVSVDGVGKVKLEQLLQSKQFGKVYILLGINELGCSTESIIAEIQKLIDVVEEYQPDSLIFLQANLHVTKKKSSSDETYNNENINKLNKAIEELADGEKIFYIDVNEIFSDSEGNLNSELSGDGIHVSAKGYKKWEEWFLTKQIKKDI